MTDLQLALIRRILGLSNQEVGFAVGTEEAALTAWIGGELPSAGFSTRLDTLYTLALEVEGTMRAEVVPQWMKRAIPAFDGCTPREMILRGQIEAVLGTLNSFNHGSLS